MVLVLLWQLLSDLWLLLLEVTKYEPSFAESLGNETPFFGNPNSKVEVYIFTDWFCPACAKSEAKIEKDFSYSDKQSEGGFRRCSSSPGILQFLFLTTYLSCLRTRVSISS